MCCRVLSGCNNCNNFIKFRIKAANMGGFYSYFYNNQVSNDNVKGPRAVNLMIL